MTNIVLISKKCTRILVLLVCTILANPVFADGIEDALHAIRVRDYLEARKILEDLVDNGNAEAMYHLGVMYRNGQGVPQDISKAKSLLHASAVKGYARAQYSYAYFLLDSHSTDYHPQEAIEWLEKATQQGYLPAVDRLKRIRASQKSAQNNTQGHNSVATDETFYLARNAIRRGHKKKLANLLDEMSDINQTGRHGRTLLIEAADSGKQDAVSQILARHPNINHQDDYGVNALAIASNAGNQHIVELLLARHAKTDLRDINGQTALHKACRNGYSLIAEKLIDYHAKVNVKDKAGRTPLMLARSRHHTKLVSLLEGHGGSDTATNMKHRQSEENLVAGVVTDGIYKGWTPLMISAWRGDTKEVARLLKLHSDLFVTDHSGQTAMSLACVKGHVAIVMRLLESGVRINQRYQRGDTCLMIASHEGHSDLVSELLNRHADLSLVNEQFEQAWLIALKQGYPDIAKRILKATQVVDNGDTLGKTGLMYAAEKGDLSIIKMLISQGVSPEKTDHQHRTALWYAAESGQLPVVEYLMRYKSLRGNINSHLLFRTIIKGRVKIAKLLIDSGSRTDFVDESGNTPVMVAASTGKLALVKLLVEKHVEINKRNKFGNTAIMLATRDGYIDVVNYLLDSGADIRIRNSNQETVVDIAKNTGNQDMVKLLTSHKASGKSLFGLFN